MEGTCLYAKKDLPYGFVLQRKIRQDDREKQRRQLAAQKVVSLFGSVHVLSAIVPD